jgi:hypothetical protein
MMMPQVLPDGRDRRASGSAGGARAAGGIDNQARVAAWLTSLVVTDQPVPWLPDGARVEAVGGDTGLAMDDVGALSDRGGLVAIQPQRPVTTGLDQRPTNGERSGLEMEPVLEWTGTLLERSNAPCE